MALSNEAILSALSRDRALASATLFPHRHPQASPPFHVEIMDLWGARDENVLIEAFREGAKSTLSEEFILMEVGFQNFQYGLIIGETYDKACQRLESIKYEASHNMRLYNLFGKLKGAIWNENKALFSNGVLLEALGWETEFRGFKHHAFRPDRAYCDDVETRERVRDSNAVDATIRKLYMELMPAMDKERGKVRWTGTPLADDCALNRLKQKPDWVCARYPICDRDIDDPNAKSLWPGRYPMEWIRAKRDQYAGAGMLREFNQEYMLIAAQTQGKPFTEDMLIYDSTGPSTFMPRTVIMDPARTINVKTSDETGHVVVSRQGTRIYVWESGGDFWKPDEIIDYAFTASDRHGSARVAIEENSLNEWLLQPIRAKMLDTGQTVELVTISAPQDRTKDNFILGLQPFFKAHDIIFVGGEVRHAKLIAQVRNFPAGKKDVLNALAYVLKVFAGMPVYTSFGDANIIENWQIVRSDTPVMIFHQGGGAISGVLMAINGQRQVVVADWVSSAPAEEAVKDMLIKARLQCTKAPFKVYVSADIMDQQARMPVVQALRKYRVEIVRSAYANTSRGNLDVPMRQEWNGKRLFIVDTRATHTLNALAGGYNFPTKNGVQQGTEPEKGLSRLVVESIECLTAHLQSVNNASELPEGLQMGRNAQGVAYPTALRRS